MIPIVSLNREIEWELRTERLILPKTAELKAKLQNKGNLENKRSIDSQFNIRQLKPEDADFIFAHSHYRDFTSKTYIRERIEADCSAGLN